MKTNRGSVAYFKFCYIVKKNYSEANECEDVVNSTSQPMAKSSVPRLPVRGPLS